MHKKEKISCTECSKRNSQRKGWFSKSLVVIVTTLALIGCSFSFQTIEDRASITDISESIDFHKVSRQGFMGGSILYNPKKPITGQLAKGVTVAVRLGYVDREIIDAEQSVYTDRPEKAQFGDMYITDIDKDSVSFKVTLFDATGKSLGTNFHSLKLNEKIDINFDGLPDLEYKKPVRKRVGFESAVYLTFLSSQETLNTAMFAVLPEQYSRGVYPSGIIGINPSGRFIISKYEDESETRSLVRGAIKGDYILNNKTGLYEKINVSFNSKNARVIDDSELVIENYEGVNFYFEESEFDQYCTPQGLIAVLPFDIVRKNSENISFDEAIQLLNKILEKDDLIQVISDNTSELLDQEVLEIVNNISVLTKAELVSLNRLYLGHKFPENCPLKDGGTNDITEVLPLYSVILSEGNNTGDDNLRAASFSEYTTQRKNIDNRFSSYFKIPIIPQESIGPFKDLSDIRLKFKTDNNVEVLSHIEANLGVYGYFSITFSNVEAKLATAVYLQFESAFTMQKSFSTSLLPGKKPIKLNTLEKPIPAGPVTLCVSCPVKIDIPLNVGGSATFNSATFLGFTGLYGGEITAGANYGMEWVRWFKVWKTWIYRPKFYIDDPYFKPVGINMTAFYLGPIENTDSIDSTLNAHMYASVTPSVQIEPTVRIATFYAKLIGKTGLEGQCDINYDEGTKKTTGFTTLNFLLNVDMGAGLVFKFPFGIGEKEFSFNVNLYALPKKQLFKKQVL